MQRRTILIAVPLAVALTASYLVGTTHAPAVAAAAATDPASQGVIVSGLGKVSGSPDVLRLQLGVEIRRPDVSAALRDANQVQSRVRAALRGDGVDAKDLQTADVSLYPSFDGKGRSNGYLVSESTVAKLRNLDRAGRTIGDAVTAGGNAARVQGVSFALEDNAALLGQARDAAYAEAKSKAERYAQLSGRSLGQVELVDEEAPRGDVPIPYARTASLAAGPGADVPVEAGQAQVSVSVTVRWSLR